MSVYLASRIEKPKHFRLDSLSRGRGKRLPYVIGFDSEAEDSWPYTLQFSLPDTGEDDTAILYIPKRTHAALHAFMEFVHRVCTSRKREYLVYGFNIAYEFTQLFHDFADEAKAAADFWFDYVCKDGARYRVEVFKAKRYFCTIRNISTKVRIRLLDAYAFFSTSLDKATRMLGIGEKLAAPKRFTRSEWKTAEFQAYAKRDAYITRLLGERIVEMHATYDVATTISAPHFASCVFRRRFLGGRVGGISEHLEQYGLASYHGGKNGYYLHGPQAIDNVRNFDIRSAYPEAMRALPDIERSTFVPAIEYQPGTHSIWRATIQYQPCKYRGIQYANGSWITEPQRLQVYATGYELDAMLERGECEIVRCTGYVMTGPSGGALADYVDTFYAMKSTATDDTDRATAKLFLNSLYGKFFQKVPVGIVGSYDWESGDYVASAAEQVMDFVAGGLYHPPIASLITGFVRAKIHRLEHKYDALMTSTDGFFAFGDPDQSEIGTRLGMLDVSTGSLRIWRERLYIFDSDKGERKAALHGFRGSVDDLSKIPLKSGHYSYRAQQMIGLGMSTRAFSGTRYPPGSFVMLPFGLDV